MNKNLTPYNNKGQQHGYWDVYWGGGILSYKCYYKNGRLIGYAEEYLTVCPQLKYKQFNLI